MEKIIEILKDIHPEFDFDNSENFVEDGFLDSFDIITLVSQLEETFKIIIDGLDVIPENFETYERINNLVKKSKRI